MTFSQDDTRHMRRALDGGIADAVLQGFESRELVGLAVYDSGARSFYNTKHPIITPKDLHGLKLRVANSDIFLQLMRLFGANPTPMSLGDTFSGMETHTSVYSQARRGAMRPLRRTRPRV